MESESLKRKRDFLTNRKSAYERVFDVSSMDAAAVLSDLAKFCRAHESTAHPDPHAAARLDGRREVWLRIQHHLQINNDDLWRLYTGQQIQGEKNV